MGRAKATFNRRKEHFYRRHEVSALYQFNRLALTIYYFMKGDERKDQKHQGNNLTKSPCVVVGESVELCVSRADNVLTLTVYQDFYGSPH